MLDWNPALYRRFESERTRPAEELLARVPLASARHVVDLGCGPGNSTELLLARFPDADVVGVDNSRPMLESARKRLPQLRFEFDDIHDWEPERPPDLIYANAALQWVPDHEALIPRLFGKLAPGGVLAIQMPDNREEPSHRAMREVASLPAFAGLIGEVDRLRTPLLALEQYYDLLAAWHAPAGVAVDIWRTAYQHVLESPAAIVEWVRATGLKPFVDRLPADAQARFLAAYEERIAAAYPARSDGRHLLAFPRLFIVARCRS